MNKVKKTGIGCISLTLILVSASSVIANIAAERYNRILPDLLFGLPVLFLVLLAMWGVIYGIAWVVKKYS